MTDLGTYDGLDILGATVSIRNTGDGLSKSMQVEPTKLGIHSTVHVVLECEVIKHTHEELKDTSGLQLVNVLKAGRATIVDGDLVREHLDAQQQRIEAAEGVLRLDFDADGPRGGEPVTVGSVLDESIDALQDAEDDETWRAGRRDELATWSKDSLRTELTDVYGAEVPSRATVNELVELLLDWEADNR